MRQYTTPEQTSKLIKLGFEKPKGWCVEGISSNILMYKRKADDEGFNYSIGELIEMLPNTIYIDETTYSKVIDKNEVFYYSWVFQTYALLICDISEDLVDNLYDMCVQLKEEGVI